MSEFSKSDFYRNVGVINFDEIGLEASPWGNDCLYVTSEQLEELKNGKVLSFFNGEYATFIILKEDDEG